MALITLLYPVVGVFLLCTAAFKARDVARDPDNRAVRAVVHTALALGLVLIMIASTPALRTIPGAEAAASTVWHIGVLWAATSFQVFLLFSTRDRLAATRAARVRRGLFAAAAVVLALAWLGADERTKDYGFRVIDSSPSAAAWQITFLALCGWAMIDGVLLVARFAGRAPARDLRVGLRVMGAGCLAGLAFCTAKIVTAAIQTFDLAHRIVPGSVLVVLVVTTFTLLFAGVLWAAVAPRVRAVPRWFRRRRAHRDLWALWNDLRRTPGLQSYVFGTRARSASGDVLHSRHLHWRLYRRVIEVEDMGFHLRPWYSQDVADTARQRGQEAGLAGDELAALVHAAVLEAAMRACRAGTPGADAGTAPVLEVSTRDSLDDAAAWQQSIQRARRCALLREVVPA